MVVLPEDESEMEATRMSLGDHLQELRGRLFKSVVVLAIAFVAIYSWRFEAFGMIQAPHRQAMEMLNAARAEHFEGKLEAAEEAGAPLDPLEYFEPGYPERRVLVDRLRSDDRLLNFTSDQGFVLRLRVCFWLAVFVAAPFMLWQMWGFIAAGLYRNERRVVYRSVPVSMLLFLGGVGFGYRVMVPYALYFLGIDDIELETLAVTAQTADHYLGFLKGLALAMGAVFQLPVIMMALTKLGLVGPGFWAEYRRHTIVGALVLAAIITPPDPVTQMLMAGPIIILYEVGIWVASLTTPQERDGGAVANAAP